MKVAFYKKWKKIALVLTSVFWASCGDDSNSSSSALYSCPSDECNPNTPSSTNSEDKPISSVIHDNESSPASSSSEQQLNLSQEQMSSSLDKPIAVYGSPCSFNGTCDNDLNSSSENQTSSNSNNKKISCTDTTVFHYENMYPCLDGICPEYGVLEIPLEQIKCKDGTKYEIQQICPENDVNLPCTKQYIEKNKQKIYSEEEFMRIYEVNYKTPKSSSSLEQITPKYGVIIDRDE